MYKIDNYSHQTIDTFETLGSFIIDRFYNHIYDKARELHLLGNAPSITEAYKITCYSYLQHFTNADMFKITIKNLYDYFNRVGKVPQTYTVWIESITREFVPADYHNSLNSKQHDHMLGTTVESIFRNFSLYMLSLKGLKMVIDNRDDPSVVTAFQDHMIMLIIEEREKMYQKFIKSLNGSKDSGLTDRLREDLQKEINTTIKLKEALKKASDTLKKVTAENDYHRKTAQKLYGFVQELTTKLEQAYRAPPQQMMIPTPAAAAYGGGAATVAPSNTFIAPAITTFEAPAQPDEFIVTPPQQYATQRVTPVQQYSSTQSYSPPQQYSPPRTAFAAVDMDESDMPQPVYREPQISPIAAPPRAATPPPAAERMPEIAAADDEEEIPIEKIKERARRKRKNNINLSSDELFA